MNKILDIVSLEKNFLDKVFDLTATISNDWPNIEQIGAGKTICLLFWEPSTRTKLSFEHAAKKLGFNILDFSPEHSSVKKGESFEDTILTLLAMQVDGFIIRHPEDHISKTISSTSTPINLKCSIDLAAISLVSLSTGAPPIVDA